MNDDFKKYMQVIYNIDDEIEFIKDALRSIYKDVVEKDGVSFEDACIVEKCLWGIQNELIDLKGMLVMNND